MYESLNSPTGYFSDGLVRGLVTFGVVPVVVGYLTFGLPGIVGMILALWVCYRGAMRISASWLGSPELEAGARPIHWLLGFGVAIGFQLAVVLVCFAASDEELVSQRLDQILRPERAGIREQSETDRSDPTPTEEPEPIESESILWSAESQKLVNTFATRKDDFYTLRNMTVDTGYVRIGRIGDRLLVETGDGRRLSDDEVEQRETWKNLMVSTNTFSIVHMYDSVGFIPDSRPAAGRKRREIVNYLFNHPMPAKECSEQYHDIQCGVCDIEQADGWSIRFTWSTGKFEEEHLDNLGKLYQEDDFGLTKEEIDAKYDDAKKICMRHGLKEMGYENPENY